MIRAAGVILFRRVGDERFFLLLRSRRHQTWSFAKGHLEPNETAIQGALREVEEETGIALSPDSLVPEFEIESSYELPNGDPKSVTYFACETTNDVQISREHDAWGWFGLDAAHAILQHENLRELLNRVSPLLG